MPFYFMQPLKDHLGKILPISKLDESELQLSVRKLKQATSVGDFLTEDAPQNSIFTVEVLNQRGNLFLPKNYLFNH